MLADTDMSCHVYDLLKSQLNISHVFPKLNFYLLTLLKHAKPDKSQSQSV